MRKPAIIILLVGYGFAFFSLPFAGVDLLIDAVGWLLVWNALRALQKQSAVFPFAAPVALALVVVSALSLFMVQFAFVLALLRAAGEIFLLILLVRGFSSLLQTANHSGTCRLLRFVFALNIPLPLLAIFPFFPFLNAFSVPGFLLGVAGHAALLLVLLRTAFVLDDANSK